MSVGTEENRTLFRIALIRFCAGNRKPDQLKDRGILFFGSKKISLPGWTDRGSEPVAATGDLMKNQLDLNRRDINFRAIETKRNRKSKTTLRGFLTKAPIKSNQSQRDCFRLRESPSRSACFRELPLEGTIFFVFQSNSCSTRHPFHSRKA